MLSPKPTLSTPSCSSMFIFMMACRWSWKRQSLSMMTKLDTVTTVFWTDGSLLENGQASSILLGFMSDTHPTKCQQLSQDTYILAHPAGLPTTPILAEKQALELLLSFIQHNSQLFLDKHIFVGSDCQSALIALAQGPLRDYTHLCTNICGHLLTNPSFLKLPTNTIVLFHIHYIPGHVGIQPNEIVDQLAKSYATSFTLSQQSTLKTDLTALKTALQSNLIKQWINSTPLRGARFHTCGLQCSHLNQRCPLPCALQCLYSRWRVGEVESAGVYLRWLNWIQSPQCRLCGYPSETTVHLLCDCPGSYPTRASLGISFDTLVCETPENVLPITRFDAWLRHTLPVEQSMTDASLLAILTSTLRKRNLHASCNALYTLRKCTKHILVIPQLNNNSTQKHTTTDRCSQEISSPESKRPAKK